MPSRSTSRRCAPGSRPCHLPNGQSFLDAFGRRSIAANAGSDAELLRGPERLSPLERLFVRAVSTRLAADDTEVIWRRDADRNLALRLRVGTQSYWLTLPGVSAAREFTGAWFAASAAARLAGAARLRWRSSAASASRSRALVHATEMLGSGARPEPLAEDGPLEIETMSRSFNQLVRRLEATGARARLHARRHLARPAHAAYQAAPAAWRSSPPMPSPNSAPA